MKRITLHIAAYLFVALAGGATLATATPSTVSADCGGRFLTFPAWYKGLQNETTCSLLSPSEVSGGLQTYVWRIGLNIVEFMLQLVGYLAAGFLIYGGFKYMTSAGSPDGMTKAKKTIMNAAIGLVISLASIAIVNVIVNTVFTGSANL